MIWRVFCALYAVATAAAFGAPVEDIDIDKFLDEVFPDDFEFVARTFGRIVGGREAEKLKYGYQVGILANSNGFWNLCGGVLIAPTWVLTAAHCEQALDKEVILGSHAKFWSGQEASREVGKIKRTIYHANYGSTRHANDIALVELKSPIVGYTPVTLFTDQPEIKPDLEAVGTKLTVTGWGKLSTNGPAAAKLQVAKVPLISNQQCQRQHPNEKIGPDMICASYDTGGVDACEGDSGGPFVGDYLGDKYLVGLVSWGRGCADARYPGVYARVSHFKDWICDKTDGAVGCAVVYGKNYHINYFWKMFWSYFWAAFNNLWSSLLGSLFGRSSNRSPVAIALSSNITLPDGVVLNFDAAAAAEAAAVGVQLASTVATTRGVRGESSTRGRRKRGVRSSREVPVLTAADLPDGLDKGGLTDEEILVLSTAARQAVKQSAKEAGLQQGSRAPRRPRTRG